MKRIATLSLLAIPLSLGFSLAHAALPVSTVQTAPLAEIEDELPSVPVSVSSNSKQAKSTTKVSRSDASGHKGKQTITVIPDVNEIIPISAGHPNRVITPFNSLSIRTTSNASIDPVGNSFYVTSNAVDRPVVVFVSDKSNPNEVMSLTFLPTPMPPVSVALKFDESVVNQMSYSRPNPKAKAWEESQPYLDTLRALLRDVALQKIPQGYTVTDHPILDNFESCYQSGLSFNFSQGQEIKGSRLIVNVGVVQNISDQAVEFREPSCSGDNVKAVSTWPNPLLMPNQKSEVYVVRGLADPVKTKLNSRQSLLAE